MSLCSVYKELWHDPSCVLQAGEHDFVKHETFVAYRTMSQDAEAHVGKMVNEKIWPEHVACSDVLLERVVANICSSKLTPRIYKKLFGCPGFD